jgi:hypothetical protein
MLSSSSLSVPPCTGNRMPQRWCRVAGFADADLEVERIVAGLPVACVSAVGPANHCVETCFRVGGVFDQPRGAIGFQYAVCSLDHITLTCFPLALHVVRFRIMHRVIELIRFGCLSYKTHECRCPLFELFSRYYKKCRHSYNYYSICNYLSHLTNMATD